MSKRNDREFGLGVLTVILIVISGFVAIGFTGCSVNTKAKAKPTDQEVYDEVKERLENMKKASDKINKAMQKWDVMQEALNDETHPKHQEALEYYEEQQKRRQANN